MPSIADTYVTLLPETSKLADGIRRAFREADGTVSEAARRWGQEIERGIGKVKVDVSADTAKARAEIDAVGRDRKATIEVDADTLGADVEKAVSSGMSAGGQSGLAAMNPALMGVGITLAAGVASSLSGLAGLLPAGLLGAGGVVGTLATGLSGVKEAWDSAGKAALSSGTDQAAKAKEVASAQRELHDAVVSEEQAQKDVATARRDALTQLRDLNMELHGGALDEKQAQLDALKARQDLATGTFKTALDYEQAQLRVEEADQRVAESHQRNIDLQTKANDERSKGVDNADGVVRANQNLARSHEQVAAAQDNLNTVTNKVSSAALTAAQDMAKLSPNAQAFVNTMIGLKPAFESLKFSVQDSLFAKLGPQIQQLATQYLPLLQGAMTGMAGTMNQAFGQIAKIFAQPETMAAMQRIFASIGGSFQIWSQSITPFTQAFLKFTEVGASFLPQLAQMAVQVGNAFNQWSSSGQLQQWMQTAITGLGELGKMLPTLGNMFMALAPIGIPVLQALNSAFTALAPAIGPLATLLASWVTAITPVLTLLIQVGTTIVTAIAPAFQQWFTAMAPVANQLLTALQPVLQTLGGVLQQVAFEIGGALVGAVQQLIPVIVPLVEQMAQWVAAMAPLLPSLTKLAVTALPMIASALAVIIPLFTKVIETLTNLANIVVPKVSSVLSGMAADFTDGFTAIKNIVTTVWNVIGPIFDKITNFISNLPGPLKALAGISGPPVDGYSGGGGSFGPPVTAPGVGPTPGTLSRGTPGAPTRGALSTRGAAQPSASSGLAPSDAALLANVPAGRYSQTGNADLTKGLGDCSSAVEDLVNLLQGNPTAGRSMSTANAPEWLTAHGFVQGSMPGAFNVGFNDHHMQATLPGGTPFNWGSDAAAANRGIGGTGASDPAFNQHYYLPAGAMPGQMPAPTGPTGAANDPYFMQYPDGYKPPGPDMGQLGQQMGGDIWSSILPDGFKNPTQFGGMKFLTGLLGGVLGMPMGGSSTGAGKGQPASYWAGGGGGGGGGIGGLLSGLAGITSQPFGNLQIGSPGTAPGEFMPAMPTPADAMASPFGVTGQAGTAGPGNNAINNSININNPVGQDHLNNMVQTATQAQIPRQRQGLRPLP